MQELRCKKCGLALEQRGDKYVCLGCGAEYQAEDARRVADEMARLLDEQKQERVANLRQQLWVEFNEEFYDRAEISRLAKGIMAYLPDDFFAQFCDLATGRDTRRLNAFLYAADVKAQSMYIWDMLAFLLRPLREETLLAVNDLLARAGAAGLDMEGFRRCNEQLAREAEKLNAGIYDATIPRDVFVAYSHEDIAQVGELVEALEAQKISCFVAARNLQHGAIQNYEEQLRSAMDSCRTVVFVSSKNSRSRDCDALKELSYIQKCDFEAAPQYRGNYAKMPKEVKRPRVEYLIDKYTGTAADAIVKEFFAGFEYCKDKDIVAKRILELLAATPAANVKYCRSCGAGNAKKAKFCSECGGREFVDTYAEYEEIKRKKAEEARREAEAVRRAEEEKKKAEEARKRAEEEKRQAEEEAAALRAELEKLKKQAQAAAAKPAEQPVLAPTPAPKPAPKASPLSDFEIENGVLRKYKGTGGDVVIPNNVKSIGNSAFQFSMRLISITIPNSVTSIGEKAFNYCMGLTSITIPSSITSIEGGAFEGCSGLTSITIPNSVTEIGDKAFRGCTGLTSITIPDSMTNIRDGVFDGCKGLISITIPNSVKSIGNSAFQWCTGLTSITIPDSVRNIEGYAFNGCTGLKDITIPNSVTEIGSGAFDGCTGLTSISIPSSVTSIGNNAFVECRGLTSITIPSSVTSIGYAAFGGCTGLTSIVVDPDNPVCHSDGNCLIQTEEEVLVAGCKTSVIPTDGSVTGIGDWAFSDCTGLKDITIPDSVTSIGEYAFYGCTGLTSITIPSSVTSIGSGAFGGCTGLTSIVVDPDNPVCHSDGNCLIQTEEEVLVAGCKTSVIPTDGSVTGIGDWAFSDCTGLKDITIPDSVTSIGEYAFYGCTGLTNITIPDSMTEIGSSAFWNCTGLTSITIPNSVKSIGSHAFSGCTGLTSITIPNSVTGIGRSAFEGCAGLISITIPSTVTSIGSDAFYGCDNAQIYCHAKEPEEWPAGWDESLKDRIVWDD